MHLPLTSNLEERLDSEKSNVLEETNAQTVFESLQRLKSRFAVHRKRWIWELLQNAADAVDAKQGKNAVEIVLTDDSIRFSHHGATFTTKEITHLIYHGSSKQEDASKKGKFGSGFLTIHLLAPTVTVTGGLSDENTVHRFSFVLNRTGSTAKELKAGMDSAWRQFRGSLRVPDEASGSMTTFECPLEGNSEVIAAGLLDLERNAPFVVSLVPEITRITVRRSQSVIGWERTGLEKLGNVCVYEVAEVRDGKALRHRVRVAGDPQTSIGIGVLTTEQDGQWVIADLGETSRLFYPLPLVGTHDIGVPFAILSARLTPAESRDGIVATSMVESKHDGTGANWELLRSLPNHFKTLLRHACTEGLTGAHILAALKRAPERDWLHRETWESVVVKPCLSALRASDAPELFKTGKGAQIAVGRAHIPVGPDCHSVYELADAILTLRDALPESSMCSFWASTLLEWSVLLGTESQALAEALTIKALATQVTAASSLQGLSKSLVPQRSADPIGWLNCFFEAAPGDALAALRAVNLFPNQEGVFRKEAELRADAGIDSELKLILEKLGWRIRAELLHQKVGPAVQALFVSAARRTVESDCIDRAIKLNREVLRRVPTPDTGASVELLCWLIRTGRSQQLSSYSVLCRKGVRDFAPGSVLLTPPSLWENGAGEFSEIFPETQILDDAYSHLTLSDWTALATAGLATRSIFTKKIVRQFDDDDELDEKGDHKPKTEASVTDVLFLEGEGNICELVGQSRAKGSALFRLIIDVVLRADETWIAPPLVPCTCGESHALPPRWMVTLAKNKWIRLKGRKTSAPTAESISTLLGDEERQKLLDHKLAPQFLLKWNIGLADVLRCSVPEEQKLELDRLSARIYGTQDDATISGIKAVLSDSAIRAALMETIHQSERVRHNHRVGACVEDALRSALEASGMRVERTGVGSDFEVENDFIQDGVLQLLQAGSWLIEVKATRNPYAWMSLRQAQESTNQPNEERYAVCVLPLTDEDITAAFVRRKCRFIAPVGRYVKAAVQRAMALKAVERAIPESQDKNVSLDVLGSTLKVRLNSDLWESAGSCFEDFIARIGNRLEPSERPSPIPALDPKATV